MKHILECPEIEKEYTLFTLAPQKYYNRMIDLTNLWIMGYESAFEKLMLQPTQDYLEDYAQSDDEWFHLHLIRDGAEDHPNYGQVFDMRLFKDMLKLRKILKDVTN